MFKQTRCHVCGETEFLTLQSAYNFPQYACPNHLKIRKGKVYINKAPKPKDPDWNKKADDSNEKLMRKWA